MQLPEPGSQVSLALLKSFWKEEGDCTTARWTEKESNPIQNSQLVQDVFNLCSFKRYIICSWSHQKSP